MLTKRVSSGINEPGCTIMVGFWPAVVAVFVWLLVVVLEAEGVEVLGAGAEVMFMVPRKALVVAIWCMFMIGKP